MQQLNPEFIQQLRIRLQVLELATVVVQHSVATEVINEP
jgi:hypothetical protein